MNISDDKLIELFESVAQVSSKVDEVYDRLIGVGNKKGEIEKLNDFDLDVVAQMKDIRTAIRQLQDDLTKECRTRADSIKKIVDSLYSHNIEIKIEEKLKKRRKAAVWSVLTLAAGGIYKLVELAVDFYIHIKQGGK